MEAIARRMPHQLCELSMGHIHALQTTSVVALLAYAGKRQAVSGLPQAPSGGRLRVLELAHVPEVSMDACRAVVEELGLEVEIRESGSW